MASDRSTERIIDLLYGELTPEEEAEVRQEVADSADLRAELDGFESLLGRIREAAPSEEVPSSVHASILDAARAAAQQAPETRVARRQTDGAEGGIWRRFGRGQGSQIALVAAVLIAGLFVVKYVDQSDRPMAPASDISAASEPAPIIAKQIAEPAEETILAEGEEAPATEVVTGGEVANDGDVWQPTPEAKPADAPLDLAKTETADREIAERPEPEVETKRRSARTRSASSAPKRKEASIADKKAPQKKLDSIVGSDLFDDDLGAEGRGSAARQDQNERDYAAKAAEEEQMAAPAATAPPMEKAEAEAEPMQQAKDYRAPAGSISAVDQRFRVNDYSGTISAADEFLKSGKGNSTDKAQALLLKAQSLSNLGRYREAVRVYESIQKNYPAFDTQTVNQGRAEAERMLKPARKKQAPKSRKQAKPSYDAMEAAPSSLD